MTPRARKVLAWGAASAVLGGVFLLYMRPQTMVALSEMLWACFGA